MHHIPIALSSLYAEPHKVEFFKTSTTRSEVAKVNRKDKVSYYILCAKSSCLRSAIWLPKSSISNLVALALGNIMPCSSLT